MLSYKDYIVIQEAEKNHKEEYDKVEKEKAELQTKLDEMVKQENILTAKVKKSRWCFGGWKLYCWIAEVDNFYTGTLYFEFRQTKMSPTCNTQETVLNILLKTHWDLYKSAVILLHPLNIVDEP